MLDETKSKEQLIAELNELRHKSEFQEILLESIPSPVFYKNVDGEYMGCNKAFEDFVGRRREEIIGKSVGDMGPKEIADTYAQQDKELLEHLGLQSYQWQVQRENGEISDVVFNKAAIIGKEGRCEGIVGVISDITERKRAEETLRESETKYRQLAENIHEVFWMTDVSLGEIIYVSPAYEKIWGKTCESLYADPQSWAESIHPDDRQTVENAILCMSTSGHTVEYRVIQPDGSMRWVLDRGFPLRNVSGEIYRITGIAEDITERKQSEEALRKTEEQYRTLFESMNQGVFYQRADGALVDVNPAALEIFGLTRDQFLGRTSDDRHWDVIHEDGSPFPAETHPSMVALKTGKPVTDVVAGVFNPLKKEYVWLVISAFPQFRPGDSVAYQTFVILHDITERRQAEQELRKSEQHFRMLVEDAPDAIFIHVDRRFAYLNKAAVDLFGAGSKEELIGSSVIDRLHPDCREAIRERMRLLIQEEVPVPVIEHKYVRLDGQVIDVQASGAPFRYEGSDGILVFVRDLTEQRNLEAQLRQAQKLEAVGTLAGGIAHEFNNILGIILGNAELAVDDIPDWNPARSSLDEIRSASHRAKDVVRQLLAFSRKADENRRPLNLVPLVKETIRFLRSSIPANIEFRQDIPKECHTVVADATQIHQILLNLSANAAHAMEEQGGILEFSLQNVTLEMGQGIDAKLQPGEYVMLTVKDTGHGIPSEFIERIFDPYFTTKDVGKGTGMGLAVVHGIVDSHGGTIQVESYPGNGTTFKILFPATTEEESVEEPKTELPRGTERILFIDDEESIAVLGGAILERLGYQVQTETDPRKAMEVFASNPRQFDLVITDMAMPGMTGDQLIQQVLQIRPEMKTILCTGYSQRVDEMSVLTLGTRAYVLKPLDRKQLATTVRGVLDKDT